MEEITGTGFKQAAAIARRFVLDIYSGDEQESRIQNVLLEEIEFDRANNSWLVTIGFDRSLDRHAPPSGLSSTMAALQGPLYRRALKRVEIDNSSGKVLRMVKREVEG